jgi:glycosyltransferase involved in cell wall biosynthesis
LTPDIFILEHFLRLVDYPRFLRYLIASRQIDAVLISHSEFGYQLLPYLRAHCPEVTFVDYCHIEEEQWKNGGYPRQAVEYQNLIDLNLVSSAHLKGWMENQGADSQRIAVCHTNIDPEWWRPDPEQRMLVRQEFGTDEITPIILYAARLCPQKQPRVFAQTMLQLVERGLRFTALVAGNGEEFTWLQSFLHRYKLGTKVRLLGAVSNERIRVLMASADIFFLPSQWEGIALSLYEAMACGVAIVGADVGGQRELVTPECGILVARGNEETEVAYYSEVLGTLLRDPERCHTMGKAGRLRVEGHFRLEQMGEKISTLLSDAARLRVTQPRAIPSPTVGQICAIQAVEYVRLTELADGLWQERGRRALPPYLLDPQNDSWRTLAYFTVRRLLLPYYRAVLDRDVPVLRPLKNRLKRVLLGGGQI